MLHIAICDDNSLELKELSEHILSYGKYKNISLQCHLFQNGFEIISSLEKGNRFDIYILDIIMPNFSGIETAKEIRAFDKNSPIVFLTSSPELALEGYKVKALNYVLKPASKEKLFETLDEVFSEIQTKKNENAIVIKSSEGMQKILVSNIIYAEAMGREVVYHLSLGKVIKSAGTFFSCHETLKKFDCFLKPHRSYIVNMKYISKILNNDIYLQNNVKIPVAQGKIKKIKMDYLNYQMGEIL